MEKRTILAFALSFAVLIAWSYFAKQEQQIPNENSVIEDSSKLPVEEIPLSPVTPSASEDAWLTDNKKISQIQYKEVIVDTPLYRAVFSNQNAAIKSFQLKQYRLTTDKDSPPVELVYMPEESSADFFSVDFKGQVPTGSGTVFYNTSDDSIQLYPESLPHELTFNSAGNGGNRIVQTYLFYPDRYEIEHTVTLTNTTQSLITGSIRASIQNAIPIRDNKSYSFAGISLLLDGILEKIKPKKMTEGKQLSGQITWIAYQNGYFLSAMIPSTLTEGNFYGSLPTQDIIKASFIASPVTLNPFDSISSDLTLYMGPRDMDTLKMVDKKLDLVIDFGWSWFDYIAKALYHSLRFFYGYVHNYGVAIIILTILVKILFWPLTHKSYKSMKEMQKIQPLMTKIRDKYKNDKQMMNKEMMGLYKTYKVNPMGGCLPMIVQIPVFIALFRILGDSIELRHAPFMLWIKDLSAPDRLLHFPFQIPFMTSPCGIPVLTILMGASMLIQQKMSPPPGDPAQAKVMMLMPIIFTVIFINFPSGLVLYWLVSNIISIGQQYRIKKRPD